MRQCHATFTGSGKTCQRQSVAGATACLVHGGAAPQMTEAARLRLLTLVVPALTTLARAVSGRVNRPLLRSSRRRKSSNRLGMNFIGADDRPEEMHITVSFLGTKGNQNAKQALNPEKIS